MSIIVNCYDRKSVNWMAHKISESKEKIILNCGVCSFGEIVYVKSLKRLLKDKCVGCYSKIEVSNENSCDFDL